MPGGRAYEFASVGLFVTCGDRQLLRRVLRAYGWPEAGLDDALSCRLMAMALLHRYSHLRWYLERLPLPGATTLEQLARHWWAL
jgi:hygromycin-B 7''-O-kinase